MGFKPHCSAYYRSIGPYSQATATQKTAHEATDLCFVH